MKLRKIAFAVALAVAAAPAFAQDFTDKDLNERIGYSNNNNEDSIKAGRGYVSYFQQSMANQDWKGAHMNYEWLIKNAPFAITGIYTQGPYMFFQLISGEKDQAKKLAYFQEMMSLFEARQKNLDVLNTFAKTKSTLGDVLALKADYYNWTAPTIQGSGYTLN